MGHWCEPSPASPLRQHFLKDRRTDPADSTQEGRIHLSVPRTSTETALEWHSQPLPTCCSQRGALLSPTALLTWCHPGPGSRESFPFSSPARAGPCPWPELGAAEGSEAGEEDGAGMCWGYLFHRFLLSLNICAEKTHPWKNI